MKEQQSGMRDKTDVKVFILYIMDAIDYPLEYDVIHELAAQNGYVGDFDFAECFSQLLELGHILEDTENGVKYYIVSSTGRMVATELQSNLLLSIREKSLKSAMRYLSFRKRKATMASSVEQREDGKYVFHAEITDPRGDVMRLDLCVASRLQAESMKKKFDKDPESVYRRLLAVITEDADYVLS